MTRTSKILFVVACGCLGLLAMAFLFRADKRVRPSIQPRSSQSYALLTKFDFTNTFKGPVRCKFGSQEEENGVWQPPDLKAWATSDVVQAHSVMTFEVRGFHLDKWRAVVSYREIGPSSIVEQTREKVFWWAIKHRMPRVARQTIPYERTNLVYGPIMGDRKPTKPAPK